MKSLSVLSLVAVALLGCSGSSSDDSEPAPTACKQTDRTGTYLQHLEYQSGSCPKDLDDQIVSFNSPSGSAAPGASCTVTSETWSEGDCKLERTVACQNPDSSSTATVVSRQQTANGSVINGLYSVNVRLKDGSTCMGLYKITATRQ